MPNRTPSATTSGTLSMVVTQRSYVVEVSATDLLALLDRERGPEFSRLYDRKGLLYQKLNDIPGVNNADYDGHLGPFISFTLDADEDTPRRQRRILGVIQKQLEIAVRTKRTKAAS